ncbi:hypothetical protein F5B20DRAFT_371324 [Whalleya microplaca]|nr:hypothetical protein F5B20DRAFT_371324 [Whalleya microplaca]
MKRAYGWYHIALWLLGFLCATSAQNEDNPNHGVRWQYPTKGLTFYNSDTVEVVYTSNFPNPLLYTFCKSGGASPIQKGKQNVTPYSGTVPVRLDWTDVGPLCWFDLRANETASYGSNSESFQYEFTQRSQTILDSEQLSTSKTTRRPTSTVLAIELRDVDPSVVATAPPSAASNPSPSESKPRLSVAAQAGIGVGAGLAGFGIAALITTIFLKRRKKQDRVENNHFRGMPPALYPGFHGGYTHGLGYSPPPLSSISYESASSNKPVRRNEPMIINRPEKSYYQPAVYRPAPQELSSNWLPAELPAPWKR